MKDPQAVMLIVLACVAGTLPRAMARGVSDNPLQMVLNLLTSLSAKVHEEGERAAAEYKEYFEWCDDASHDTRNTISTATMRKGKLEAKINALGSSIEASTSKVEDLAAAVASGSSELSKATELRTKEAADFAASEQELVRIGSQLDRAVAAIEHEAEKSPAAFTQLGNTNIKELLESLSVVVDAAGLTASDRPSLLALAQAANSADDDAATHEVLSGKPQTAGILDALEDLKVKAEAQLATLRNSETEARHNYELLRQSLESELETDNKDLEEEKAAKAEAEEGKASAQGDLQLALQKEHSAEESLQTVRTACMQTAADHEASVKARDEELAAIAKAIDLLRSTTSGAASQSYALLQLSSRGGDRAVALLRRLARQHHSTALAQLASRAAAVLQYGVKHGEDPFIKVRGLIQSLIESLQREADSEATEKAFCDEELAKTESKKGELDDDTAKLTVKIDQAAAKSADLKEEVRELQLELGELTSLQAHMDKMRQETHAEYAVAKADLEMGVNGVRKALGVLREYYSAEEPESASLIEEGSPGLASLMQQPAIPVKHTKSTGAGSSIIGILEVIEQDFATNLAKEETQEEDAQTEYQQLTHENTIAKTVKDKDVEHKSQQIKQLSQSLAELTADRDSVTAEATAVGEYYEKLKERCIAKPEAYEKRKERREAEIQGLKEALDILENEASFLQRKRHGHIRGSLTPR